MSREYNSAGRILVVDEVVEVGSSFSRKTESIKRTVQQAVLRRNYSGIARSISEMSSDDWVTAQEKSALSRELGSVRSSYSSLSRQAAECGFDDPSSESHHRYQAFAAAFSALNGLVGPIVSDPSQGQAVDGAALSSAFILYYQASAALEDDVFLALSKQQESLSLVLSAASFSYDAYGNLKKLVDSQGNEHDQSVEVYVSQFGLDREITLLVNGQPVVHDFGSYTILPQAMEGRTFIHVQAVCGDLVRTNIITRVTDGGDAVAVQILSLNGNQFRSGTCRTTLIASVWRGDIDITDSIGEESFFWKRKSQDPASDEAWNTSGKAIGHKTVELFPSDVAGRAVFTCEVNV